MKKFLAISLLALTPYQSLACAFPLTTRQALAVSTDVFTGNIASISCENGLQKIDYVVSDLWKGDIEQNKTVYGKACNDNDQQTFDSQEQYLVYTKISREGGYVRHFYILDPCGGYTQKIKFNFISWAETQFTNLKYGMPMDWNIFKKYGANQDIHILGKPIYKFDQQT